MPEPSTAQLMPCTIAQVTPCGADVFKMRLHAPELASALEPGQFFDLYIPGDASSLLRSPFSWSRRDVEAGEVEFAFKVVGDGTRRLSQMPVGTQTDVLGPCGHGWTVPEGTGRVLVASDQAGVVSLVALACDLRARGVEVDFVQGEDSAAEVIYEEEITASGAALYVATSDASRGPQGCGGELAAQMIAQGSYDRVYACGPDAMMAMVASAAHDRGVACEVSMERLMACGFGACTTCLVETRSGRKGACMAGPVFDAEEVLW